MLVHQIYFLYDRLILEQLMRISFFIVFYVYFFSIEPIFKHFKPKANFNVIIKSVGI